MKEKDIQNIKNEALAIIMNAGSKDELEELRIKYLGRKGEITSLIKNIKDLDKEQKKTIGRQLNELKKIVDDAIQEQIDIVLDKSTKTKEYFDITVPGIKPEVGAYHPLTIVVDEIIDIFRGLGYQITDGYQIETDKYNFEALNFGKHHPARDMQQTLYVDPEDEKHEFGDVILRTHTSAMQGRVMENTEPPFKVLVPGLNYRYEQVDASHGFQFHQVEGFVVDENIHLTDLFGTIDHVLKELFGGEVKLRYAATYFPFVEPGVDTYMACTLCNGKGCSFCKKSGWSEIMPAGMIHPNVLNYAGIDTEKWNGFAFAIGTSRVVNLKYGIEDLRTLTNPDRRVIEQFK